MANRSEPTTQKSLIIDARQGSADAWNDLCHIYVPVVLHWARTGIRYRGTVVPPCSPQDAEEIAQTVMARLLTKLNLFVFPWEYPQHEQKTGSQDHALEETVSFRPWLYVMTVRVAIDLYRKEKGVPGGKGGTYWKTILESQPAEEDTAESGSAWIEVEQALELMKTKYGTSQESCDLFIKRVETLAPYDELGREFGLSAENARNRFRLVRKRLQQLLAGTTESRIVVDDDTFS